jgi:hypothetical protein
MFKLTDKELISIHGGVNISGSLINSFTGAIKILLDVSRSLGTALRRIYGRQLCPL